MTPYSYIYRRKKSRKLAVIAVLAAVFAGALYMFLANLKEAPERSAVKEEAVSEERVPLNEWVEPDPDFGKDMPQYEVDEWPTIPIPPAPDMARMKAQGCVADGFLSGYGGDIDSSIALINRSKCYYLHRALETWLKPPDFKLARKIQSKVTKPNTVYGMFIAEAITTNEEYRYPAEDRDFDFGDMCRPGSKNYWGEHTCKPSLDRKEYRKYLRYITEQAMDMGIQSFLFGQVFYQDSTQFERSIMPEVIREMREYADFRGMKIVIGAQTNDITDERYLRLFDFIEGGIGLGSDGSIEDGACFSRWWKQPGDWCWALLWHDRYAKKANNVFLHLDWSGKIGDDMDVFTKMEKDERAAALKRLHAYFTSRNFGFLMPMLATLHKDDVGCRGPKKRFYSASRKYTCQDEDAINAILSGK